MSVGREKQHIHTHIERKRREVALILKPVTRCGSMKVSEVAN
jgi:hypothetical protein